MATGRRRLAAGSRRREPKAHRALRVEPLESRTVLSAIGLQAPAFHAERLFTDSPPGLVETVSAAKFNQAAPHQEVSSVQPRMDSSIEGGFVDLASPLPLGQSPASSQSSASVEHVTTPPAWTLPEGTDVPDNSALGSSASKEAGSEPAGATLDLPPASAPAASPTEGGFVILVYVSPQESYQPGGQSVAIAGLVDSIRLATSSGGSAFARESATLQSTRPNALPGTPVSNGQAGEPATVTPGPSLASLQADAALEGGPIDLGNAPTQLDYGSVGQPPPTVQPLMAPGALTAPAEANNLPDFAPLRNAWPDSPLSGEAGSGLAGPAPGLSRTGTETNSLSGLGGPVESSDSPEASSRVPEGLQQQPSWSSEEPDAGEPVVREPGSQDEAFAGTRVAGDDGRLAGNSEEGGMVELAAVLPSTESSRDSLAPAAAASPRLPAGVNVVQMDNGVALFHAFDLGTSPNEHHGQAGPVAQEANETDLPPDPTPSALPSDSPAADTSTPALRRPDGRSVRSASELPAVAVAVLLAAVDAVHLEEASEKRVRFR